VTVIKKVLNSSVVLVEENGKEMVFFGKGIGYGKKPGEVIQENQAESIFLKTDKTKSNQLLELTNVIPFEFFEMTRDILEEAEKQLKKTLNPNLYFTLTDHLHFSIERAKEGMNITNRLYWEIKSYYPEEFEIGKYAVDLLNENFNVQLPQEEASNIAFHLVNAQSESDIHTDSFKYAKLIGGVVNMVRYSIQTDIDTTSIHYTRFITHVRFFVERYYSNKMLNGDERELYKQMWTLYPSAMEVATKVKNYIEKIETVVIPEEETVYLGVHINRLMKHSI
jgi:beta-glucoside operon transcriptional antiterminator